MGKVPVARWTQASRLALDWLFPPRCAGCGALGSLWCDTCHAGVVQIGDPVCECCGLPLAGLSGCAACASHPYAFDASRAWGVYAGGLRRAILSLKHRSNAALGAVFAQALLQIFQQQGWKVDMLIPIPLGPQRLRQRGYNQIDLLARPFGELAGLPYAERVLIRQHDTLPQFELGAAERWINLRGSFVADPSPLAGQSVLLVDDIMTTGATLDSAAIALKKAGAKRVFALTLARTMAGTSDL